MSEKELLKLRIYPIKSELAKVSNDIKIYLNNEKNNYNTDFKNFKRFKLKYNILTCNLRKIMNDLIPLC